MGPLEKEAILRSLAEVLTGSYEVGLNGLAIDSAQLSSEAGGVVVDLEDGTTLLLKVEAL